MRQLKAHKATKAKTMEDVKAIELIGKLTERFTRTCPPQPEYQQRLAEEFEIILDLRFVDYFLQIRDILDITQDIPHMTRGSAGSSLVCYLMGITDVDPMQPLHLGCRVDHHTLTMRTQEVHLHIPH